MSQTRYSPDTKITKDDFKASGWSSVVSQSDDYRAMWTAFSKAAEDATRDDLLEHGKILWLLADACSMMLEPANFNSPFKPAIEFGHKRSAIPQDFTDDDMLFFSQIVDDIDNHLLKARIADLVWFCKRTLGVNFALIAIDSYLCTPLDAMTMVRVGKDCMGRAIALAVRLKDGAGDRLSLLTERIFNSLMATKIEDGFLGVWLSELLTDNNLAADRLNEIAQKIETLTNKFGAIGDSYKAQEYAATATIIYRTMGNDEKTVEMMVYQAESIVKDAENAPSNIAAIHFYEKAIQIYRTIPKEERSKYDGDTRISELRALLTQAGQSASTELKLIQTEGIDISQLIEEAEKMVRGKDTHEALLSFANLSKFANYENLRKNAIKNIKQSPLHVLFPATVISRDGRAIAKQPGLNLADGSSENEQVIFSEMIKNYLVYTGLVVQGRIIPAKHIIYLEHRFCEQDIYSIVKQSPIIPIGREWLVTKALYAGFENDFIACLHLLIPQIEHLVRFHLKEAGAKTTNLDKNGIEHENGLSTLVELQEMVDIFGKDLTFEFKALLCSSFGPNLRNEIAHGLIEQNEYFSAHSIYTWWLMFKIIFNSFWKLKAESGSGESSDNLQDSSSVLETGT